MVVRLRDVAAAAGVSDATVSLALAGNPRISTATSARVIAAANQLGYRPNSAARALRTESTKSLGLIVSDVANPFFAELAGTIERQAAHEGYSLILCNSDEDVARQDDYLLNLLAGSQVDGVLLVPTASTTPGLRALAASGAKIVLLDRPITVSGTGAVAESLRTVPIVSSDPRQALADAAELLARLGHRRVGVVAPPLATPLGRDRRGQIRDALVSAGFRSRDIVVEEGDFRQESGYRAAEALLASGNPTVIIAADGPMGVGALKALRAHGIRVPHDMSVICFDDAPWFDLFDPPLSAIAQPIEELARAAIAAVLAQREGNPVLAAHPPCTFISRSSCGVPAG
ncbi:LacI family DNA-binding transcriptional regulator [Flexivirga caeni]|uniref:LacI family transcriptional regulator n=1 Tax=Flexivirga caeni TaxID=2294115 RepID=A0A3M9M1S0_9MICO|nr:LacI family DNA-binding transcriptional regulator [Flexivirga caeni]RNI19519.1 LacI family transcriptional regulator [Flexivirga caeni]